MWNCQLDLLWFAKGQLHKAQLTVLVTWTSSKTFLLLFLPSLHCWFTRSSLRFFFFGYKNAHVWSEKNKRWRQQPKELTVYFQKVKRTHTHTHVHTHTHTNPKYYRFVQRVKWPKVLGVFLVLVLVLFLTEFVVKIFGEIKDTGKVMKHISLSWGNFC